MKGLMKMLSEVIVAVAFELPGKIPEAPREMNFPSSH